MSIAKACSEKSGRILAVIFASLFALSGVLALGSFLGQAGVLNLAAGPLLGVKLWFAQEQVDPAVDGFLFGGNLAKETNVRVAQYCKAFQLLEASLSFTPLDARKLIKWANLRQVLGTYPCTGEVASKEKVAEATTFAKEIAPANSRIFYAAGLIEHLAGERKLALSDFRRSLELDARHDTQQMFRMYSAVTSIDDMYRLVPEAFPQARDWLLYIEREHPSVSSEYKDLFGNKLASAIQRSISNFKRGAISLADFRRKISLVLGYSDSAAFKSAEEKAWSMVARTERSGEVERYFQLRAKTKPLSVLRGYVPKDIRPGNDPIAFWGDSDFVYLDSYHQSVGFYLADGQRLNLIEFLGEYGGVVPEESRVHVLGSFDNYRWEDITNVAKLFSFKLDGIPLLAIEMPSSQGDYRYWKINYDSNLRMLKFGRPLRSFVRVFGEAE